ncbi:MAG: hypothetical protein Q9207_004413 [Kuettlingeria erythrocarpa]
MRSLSSTGDKEPILKLSGWLLKRREISDDEVKAIYGKGMPRANGNRIMELVQEQRVEGMIDEDIPEVPPRRKEQALAWLRKNVPLDEDQAILTRLDREEENSLKPQVQRPGTKSPHAESREEKEEKEKAEAEGKPLPLSREQALVRRQEESEARVQKWKDKAKADDLHSVPQMSFVRRVGPATLMTAGVLFLCVMFTQNYNPPSQAARLFSSISPAVATISVLIGMNLHEDIGRGPFLAVYIGCGVAASYGFLLNTVLFKHWAYVSMGCSGALCALLSIWCCINLDRGIRIWPLPPQATEAIPPLLALAMLISVDVYGLLKGLRLGKLSPNGSVDHVSHLAGYGGGILTAQFLRPSIAQTRNKDRKQMQRVEKSA